MEPLNENEKNLVKAVSRLTQLIVCLMLVSGVLIFVQYTGIPSLTRCKNKEAVWAAALKKNTTDTLKSSEEKSKFWQAPDTNLINNEPNQELIYYGRQLIINTSYYLGPKGKVYTASNGMNCQNCHLEAGTKIFGNNYSAVAPTYPKFRERSGSIENVYKRINDCFERSLNGKSLDTNGKEMQAIAAYINWLGRDQKKGEKPKGSGLKELTYLNRATDPEKGKIVYLTKCKVCHAENGEGKMNPDALSYQYPPLWGEHSYNNGAGLYRLSRFAAYVKSNMPQGTSYENPQLSDEEAWDVAAFVNSQARPKKILSKDWPKISGKPVDHPFGPYADKFAETQHKYGPFEPIAEFKKKEKKTNPK